MRSGRLSTPVINDHEVFESTIGRVVVLRASFDVNSCAWGPIVAGSL